MKSKLLPLLIAGVTVGSVGSASAGAPTIYGKANLTLNKYNLENLDATGQAQTNQNNWKMESNASRIGIKGDIDIAGSLKGVYKLEYEAFLNSDGKGDNGSDFKQRNTYVGLQDKWGTVVFGRHDTPLKLSRVDVEAFHDMPIADANYILVGENRLNSVILYSSPTFSGFALTLAAAPGEKSGEGVGTTDNAKKHDKNDNGIADSTSVALTYTIKDKLFLALSHDQNVLNTNVTQASGQYTVGPVKLGAIWLKAKENRSGDTITGAGLKGFDSYNQYTDKIGATTVLDLKEQDGWLANAQWSITKAIAVKAQYGTSSSEHSNDALKDTKLRQVVVGADYKLNDSSKLFAYYATLKAEGDKTGIVSADDTTDKTFAVGYELKF